MVSFAEWLKIEMKSTCKMCNRKYKRQELAKAIGVSKASVDKWLGGNALPKVSSLWKLCQTLSCEAEEAVNKYLEASRIINDMEEYHAK